jgi:hypothetical protein
MLKKQNSQFTEYQISTDSFDEGGYVQFYHIKNHPKLGFKEFCDKKYAIRAYKNQQKLAQFDLAPKIFSKITRLQFDTLLERSGWGYISEKASILKENSVSLQKIQKLVDDIYNKTKLKFWDCHWYNLGLIKRGHSKKLVCIDTGWESFDSDTNAWRNPNPGPKCSYCLKYDKCKCE